MKKLIVGVLVISAVAALIDMTRWALSLKEVETLQIAKLELSSLRGTIRTSGKIEAEKIREIRSPIAGFCREIPVQAGEILKSGQPICVVEDPSFESVGDETQG